MRQRARRYICLYCQKHKKQSVLLSEAHLHPESQKQVDALMFTGAAATVEDAQNYYKQVAADYQAELETLEKLSDPCPNNRLLPQAYQISVPKEDGVGFEI